MQLAVTNIQRAYRCCTTLEQAVCESAGGSANIDGADASHVDIEGIKGGSQLSTCPAHERFGICNEVHGFLWSHKRRWLRLRVGSDADKAGLDGPLGLCATLDQFSADKLGVESSTGQDMSSAPGDVPA